DHGIRRILHPALERHLQREFGLASGILRDGLCKFATEPMGSRLFPNFTFRAFSNSVSFRALSHLMLRIIRFPALVCLLGFAPLMWAQSPSSLAVPEDYFPGLKSLLETALQQSPRMIARNAEEVIAEAWRAEVRA